MHASACECVVLTLCFCESVNTTAWKHMQMTMWPNMFAMFPIESRLPDGRLIERCGDARVPPSAIVSGNTMNMSCRRYSQLPSTLPRK